MELVQKLWRAVARHSYFPIKLLKLLEESFKINPSGKFTSRTISNAYVKSPTCLISWLSLERVSCQPEKVWKKTKTTQKQHKNHIKTKQKPQIFKNKCVEFVVVVW